MPDAPQLAGKARHATALLGRYNQLHNDKEKAATIALLNELFPDIRFKHEPKAGLTVFYLEGRVVRFPRSVQMHASLILEVRSDGRARVVKDRLGAPEGRLVPAVELLAVLGGTIPRRSRWERIGADDDWL